MACLEMNASTSSASHTVTLAPSLKGFGKRPSRTQRHTVVGLTGSRPGRVLVDASSAMRITRCDMRHPLKIGRGTAWGESSFIERSVSTLDTCYRGMRACSRPLVLANGTSLSQPVIVFSACCSDIGIRNSDASFKTAVLMLNAAFRRLG